ncbi:MAG: hypothetical protein KGL39_35185 [Patescibacteria group bacterium]|nr:hypothetical protein [Patescibacteria group bacterium]
MSDKLINWGLVEESHHDGVTTVRLTTEGEKVILGLALITPLKILMEAFDMAIIFQQEHGVVVDA